MIAQAGAWSARGDIAHGRGEQDLSAAAEVAAVGGEPVSLPGHPLRRRGVPGDAVDGAGDYLGPMRAAAIMDRPVAMCWVRQRGRRGRCRVR